MKIKKKLAVTLTLLMTLSIVPTNNYALENNKVNETKKEEIVITKDKNDKKLEDTSDKTKNTLSVTRISGSDRYDTSFKIQEFLTKDEFSYYAVFASGEGFSDALSAGILAGEFEAPLILVRKDSIPKVISDNYSRITFGRSFLVGGTNSVSKKVEDEIHKNISVTIRLAGKNRLDTALSIYGPILEKRKELVLGDAFSSYNGYVYADALTAMPYMYQLNKHDMGPLPLLPYAGEDASIVFGGYNSVPKLVGEKSRIYGADRYKTAVEISKAFKSNLNKDVDTIVLASGEDYPDALCAGPLASSKNAAILLTNSKTLNEDTREYIKANTNIKNIIIVGGERSISSSVENELKTLR
ncbi:MAG: cell wall-binding repeat-containing protein [Peptostreptococcus sp.]|jgi:conserved domain protein|uniref:cell wall-binding repeat-containing protein n=1 Tax=Peptostreptococcus sp. TaxID=1262 RepID=UPI001CB23E26|nr:cell wall-binding repeat-containing protein [Peptostreptococcus sp.]MBF1056565.1 cell wall-binding repeat-containing protein [Peptostreptococcus sp.]